MSNMLYYGDNLDILRRYIADESVDLVYLDPPFKSNQDYNVLSKEYDGSQSTAQIKAFEDTWRWNEIAARTFVEVVEKGGNVSRMLQAFRSFLGENDMMAYLSMMAPRLVELKRVMKSTASIYLHCDSTASHYLKVLMDAVFGPENLRNEVIWSYRRYTAASNRFQRLHDVLLFYGKGATPYFYVLRDKYGEKSGKADSHYKKDKKERWYRWQKRRGKKPYKIYLSDGRRLGDVWDIPLVNASAKERLGYPTQKPEALLERIITASSKAGDTVLDPFCGCGTTIGVAEKLKRKWIGIDITYLAVHLVKQRLKDTFGDAAQFSVVGEPVTLSAAIALARQDRFQFQLWALGLVDARSADQKKGPDRGIDGRIYFHDDLTSGKTRQIVISVKSGGVSVKDVRDLRSVVEREKAEIGVLITLEQPTKPMRLEATTLLYYQSPWGKHPRLQIITIEELLGGKEINYPHVANITFKKASRHKGTLQEEQSEADLSQ